MKILRPKSCIVVKLVESVVGYRKCWKAAYQKILQIYYNFKKFKVNFEVLFFSFNEIKLCDLFI